MTHRHAARLALALGAGLFALPAWMAAQPPARVAAPAPREEGKAAAKETPKAAPKEAPKAESKSPPAAKPVAIDWGATQSWRVIGPANMSGRLTDIAVSPSDPSTYYVASASGGLLKTTNNGTSYTHQFDREKTVSIGAVAVAATNADIVYVGTGEGNPRNSVSYGNGVYKSTDGGKSWANLGLEKTYQIGKIVIHPKNPDVVYVGAMGRLYGKSADRGVFKTTDGGKTWAKVLFVNDLTGITDLVMHPTEPDTLIAAAWEHQRDEFDSFVGPPAPEGIEEYGPAVSYGKGSGIHRTTDGGKTWTRLESGLPTVAMGRIGLSYAAKDPKTVYAIITTEKFGTGNPAPPQLFVGVTTEEVGEGLKVGEVTPSSPASAAKIEAGDILTTFDGKKLADSDALSTFVGEKKAGDKVSLGVLREGKPLTVEITLAPRGASNRPGAGPRERLTLGIYGEDTLLGIKVEEVVADSAAYKAELKNDDVIVTVDEKPATLRGLARLLPGKKAGDKLKLTVTRGGAKRDVELTLIPTPQDKDRAKRPYAASLSGQAENISLTRQGPEAFQTGGLYRSDDNGTTWKRVNSYNPRPMYFSQIRVDPNDTQTVYILGTSLYRTTDGGKTVKVYGNSGVHADHHAMWIDPRDSRHMLIGTDGGLYATYDRAQKWDHHSHMGPLCQFYHIDTDSKKPYRVFGGLQDNGSWAGPSQTLRGTGSTVADWYTIRGGDGFVCRVDPFDSDLVYSESQNGRLGRRNLRTGESAGISVDGAIASRYRWNWNTPFILSPSNPGVITVGSNVVHRSINRGDRWKRISPNLTRTNRGSLTALAESPLNADVLWAGTDDGFVWLTRDGGQNWTNVTAKIALPGPRWVATLEASRTVEGRVYVAFDAHRSDDDEPYVFVSEDFGVTFKSIRGNLPVGSTRVLREDRSNPELLYCGTEFSAFASIDRGKTWARINGNLPTVAVHEFAQPMTAEEVVVATHGRGAWVTDVSALRQLKPAVLEAKATLLPPAAATRWRLEPGREGGLSPSERLFAGTNPPREAGLFYALTQPAQKVTLTVSDAAGKLLRTYSTIPKSPGLHRVGWDLRGTATAARPGFGTRPGGLLLRQLPPGTYRVALSVDGVETVQSLTVEADPNAPRDASATAEGEDEERPYEVEEETEERVRDR